jgi:hypothetical protein
MKKQNVHVKEPYIVNYQNNLGYHMSMGSRDSSFGIATGYGLDDGGSEFESR